ncbi:MAG: twin-arginine translocation pathway signal [Xanthobacteraceae bacterium]
MTIDSVKARLSSLKIRRAAAMLALGACAAAALTGCTQMPDAMSGAFADPSKYDLYNCAQLRTARRENAKRVAELRGLVARAETGTGGTAVAEVAYGNDLVSARASALLADQVWKREHCDSQVLPPEKPDPAAAAAPPPPGRH